MSPHGRIPPTAAQVASSVAKWEGNVQHSDTVTSPSGQEVVMGPANFDDGVGIQTQLSQGVLVYPHSNNNPVRSGGKAG